jgi:hypothetical protein
MEPIPINCARVLRDGGIHAVAALNAALAEALAKIPLERQQEIKHAVGRAMAAVLDETVEPAVRAYPELEPDDATWASVTRARAAGLAASCGR